MCPRASGWDPVWGKRGSDDLGVTWVKRNTATWSGAAGGRRQGAGSPAPALPLVPLKCSQSLLFWDSSARIYVCGPPITAHLFLPQEEVLGCWWHSESPSARVTEPEEGGKGPLNQAFPGHQRARNSTIIRLNPCQVWW